MEIPTENTKIEIGKDTLNQLNVTRKWTMFLSIIGFIFLGLILIIGVIAGTFLTAFSTGENNLGVHGPLMFIPLVVVTVIYFFPILFLFRFSKHSAHAVNKYDVNEFNLAIKNLKLYFAFLGILVIVILSLYVVVLVVAGSSMAFLKGL
jgi:hypothetical protein